MPTDWFQELCPEARAAHRLKMWKEQNMSTRILTPGLDVSNHQGIIDWDTVAACGYRFALIKATEGVGYTDRYFERNWAECRRVGMVRGAYHYARPDLSKATTEADYFLTVVDDLQVGDLLMLDLETGNGNLLTWALDWLIRVHSKVGFKPLLYSGLWFMLPRGLVGNHDLSEYGLVLAHWDSTFPDPPASWPFVAVWQHSATQMVPGIRGAVDTDYFNGPADRVRLYGRLS